MNSSLPDRLRKVFADTKLDMQDENDAEYSIRVTASNFAAQRENARLRPLFEELLKCVEALKSECFCPGENSWITGKEIICDPCEKITALSRVVDGIEEGK